MAINIINCFLESEIDTIEISLRKEKKDLISKGDFESADKIADILERLDYVSVCDIQKEV